jgi:hypothetical protein
MFKNKDQTQWTVKRHLIEATAHNTQLSFE